MKTLAMLLCMFLVALGCIKAWFYSKDINQFAAWSVVMFIGCFAFLIIAYRTEKVKGYNSKHWMNR